MTRPDWAYDHRNEISVDEAEGKTVAFTHDGWEQIIIGFEDETFITKSVR